MSKTATRILRSAEGELVVAVHLPANPPPSAYEKCGVRGAIDFPLAGIAVALTKSGGKIGTLRIALTGTNSRPFLLAGTELLPAGRSTTNCCRRSIGWCRSRCSPCAPRSLRPITAASALPRWRGGLSQNSCTAE